MRTGDRWYKRIVRDSRYNDRMRDRTIDPTRPYIDSQTLIDFQNEQQNLCYYCQTPMNWIQRRSGKTGLTLERKNNRVPHYKSNCLGLCCKSCNSKRYTRERGLLMRYFQKWKSIALDVRVQTDDPRAQSFVS